MSTKPRIVSDLGESALLLPHLMEEALAANDRLKLCFTLLQTAARRADHPEEPAADLIPANQGSRLDSALVDGLSGSRREADGTLYIPGSRRIRDLIVADLATMREPLEKALSPGAESLSARARQLINSLPALEADRIPEGLIDQITSMRRPPGRATQGAESDSIHAWVMDTHRALNALQASLAQEDLDGARVWRIAESDRQPVRAFMSGVSETAPLKFRHPGLGTTATRMGERLIIQNDIGTTDAHVLVVHIEGKIASLTYTDVHARRLAFLQALLKPFEVQWSRPAAQGAKTFPDENGYLLAVGRIEAPDAAALERYLKFLGSRLVFLIDWNRARKRLQAFVSKADGVRLLKWAADHNVGHRGFLELGGERLIYDAIEFAQQTPLHYGERLDETLGADAAFEYLQFVLNEASTGLLQGRSERFIRDEIKAELARRLRATHVSVLTIALSHAERVFDLASAVHDGMLCCAEPQAEVLITRNATRARRWEQEADAIVARVRALALRTPKFEAYAALMHEADDAADGLEEAAFLMTHLAAASPPRALIEAIRGITTLLVEGAQEWVKMFAAASQVTREGAREDLHDFFGATDRVVAIEHRADAAERELTGTLLTNGADARTLFLVSNLARVLESAADALSLTALKLRDHLLNEVANP